MRTRYLAIAAAIWITLFLVFLSALTLDRRINPQYWHRCSALKCACEGAKKQELNGDCNEGRQNNANDKGKRSPDSNRVWSSIDNTNPQN